MSTEVLKPIKVGDICGYRTAPCGNKVAVTYKYRNLQKDVDGWYDASKYLPEDFELVRMQNAQGKIKSGWLNGSLWDGYKIIPGEQIVRWRRGEELEA